VTELQQVATEYAQQGLSVLPLEPRGKRPIGRLVKRGHLSASADPEVVGSWWAKVPDANIGIACSLSGIVVFDIDRRNGGERPDCLPDTFTVETGDGEHLYYCAPADFSPAQVDDEGIDVKWNGYVVAAPSIHPNGKTYSVARQDVVRALPSDLQAFLSDDLSVIEEAP
jgi:hypothetical protein